MLYDPVEIPNAVAVPGGTCLIQSVTSWIPEADSQAHNMFIGNTQVTLPVDPDAAIGSTNVDDSVVSNIQAVIPIPAGYAVGNADHVASVLSVGAVCKAAAGSTSLWVYGITTSTDTLDSDIKIKFGIVKD